MTDSIWDKEYTKNKILFILDNLLNHVNKINLDTPEGIIAVKELQTTLINAKGQTKNMVETIKQQFIKVKNLDTTRQYTDLINKLLQRLDLINEQFDILKYSEPKTNISPTVMNDMNDMNVINDIDSIKSTNPLVISLVTELKTNVINFSKNNVTKNKELLKIQTILNEIKSYDKEKNYADFFQKLESDLYMILNK